MGNIRSLIRGLLFKCRYGSHMEVHGRLHLDRDSECIIKNGKMVFFGPIRTRQRVEFSAVNGMLQIGKRCFFNWNCIVACRNKITIGNNCSFGPNVCIYDHDHLFDENGVKATEYKLGEVVIGDNCWIGAGAIILRGTHIGDGCVIGAGTVVKGEVPPHRLVTAGRELTIRPIRETH